MNRMRVPLIGSTVTTDAGQIAPVKENYSQLGESGPQEVGGNTGQYNPSTPATPTSPEAPTAPTAPSLHQVRIPQPVENTPQQFKYVFDQYGRARAVALAHESDVQTNGTPQTAADNIETNAPVATNPPLEPRVGGSGSDVSGMQRQIQDLTSTVQLLAQHALKGDTPKADLGPQPPDPTQFDMYDANQLREYNRLNSAYVRAEVSHQLSNAMAPHGSALQNAQWTADYNILRTQNQNDPHFTEKADVALRLVALNPTKFTIPEAYNYVSDLPLNFTQKNGAREDHTQEAQQQTRQNQSTASNSQPPQKRTLTVDEANEKAEQAKRLASSGAVNSGQLEPLPSNIKGLGDIMAYNYQTGRRR